MQFFSSFLLVSIICPLFLLDLTFFIVLDNRKRDVARVMVASKLMMIIPNRLVYFS